MKVTPTLNEKMKKCMDLFKEAYNLADEITEEINNKTNNNFEIDLEDVTTCLIDHEDVDELVKYCDNESFN